MQPIKRLLMSLLVITASATPFPYQNGAEASQPRTQNKTEEPAEPPSLRGFLAVAEEPTLSLPTSGMSRDTSAQIAAISAQNARQAAPTPPTYPTSHQVLMSAAGIAASDFPYVDFIVSSESGWNRYARNPSGACGLVQALPCSKIPGDWTDPVNALSWGNQYALSRYGSWYAAYLFWQAHRYW